MTDQEQQTRMHLMIERAADALADLIHAAREYDEFPLQESADKAYSQVLALRLDVGREYGKTVEPEDYLRPLYEERLKENNER